ncbi:hypothetical protein JHK82_024987 [Glycine max]|nr:hypothetical protein JHK85_025602 [Glycine max]KAG5133799.1 hypothetical protein JHK82_024987 [Glycine max]
MAASKLFSASLLVSMVTLLVLSSDKCLALQCGVSYETITVVNEFPHDPQAFTQGLLYTGNDTLFESTGLYGEIGTFNHDMNDGWGLATDGKVLFGSDGSSTLYQMIQTDPQTFKVNVYALHFSGIYIALFSVAVSKQVVYYKGHEVHNLNELEYINGEVWANVLPTDCIVRISPSDGSVLGWILLQDLKKELVEAGAISEDNILNGIAWDGEQKRIFVTGKLWPKLYEIKVSPIKEPIEEGTIEQLCLPEPYVPPSNLVLADPAQRE